jgi:hypothetical protein
MVMTEWWELRSGVINEVIVVFLLPVFRKKKKKYTGEGFGGQQFVRVGVRLVAAEVIEGPDEDGRMVLLVRQYDNHAFTAPEKLLAPLPVGKKIKVKLKTIVKGYLMHEVQKRAGLAPPDFDDDDDFMWVDEEEVEEP